jgi:arylsulfatase A-like enzyme
MNNSGTWIIHGMSAAFMSYSGLMNTQTKRSGAEGLKVICTLILLWAAACVKPSPQPPNIILFLVDDMGWQDTSVPFHSELTDLNRSYHTPNMEILATAGMKFTQAYACAVCSPSRISLMTGWNAARHGVTNWTLRKDRSPDPVHPRIQPPDWNMNGLSPDPEIERTVFAATLPGLLREAGYRTIHAGKAHFGAQGTPGENPLNLGFDENIAGHAAGGPGSYGGRHDFSAAWRGGDRIWDVPGLEAYHGREISLTEALTLEANQAIDRAVTDGKPFYLYMSHYAVHAPFEEDPRFFQEFLERGLSEFDATFASMLKAMDKSLGDIMANLERHGIADHTILVFMSDNGSPKQTARNLPLRGHKLLPYEGGTRVPLIVKWPGEARAGSVTENYVMIEDIFPTLLEMAGIKGEAHTSGSEIDGVSFVPLLRNTKGYPADRAIFWHFPHTYDQFPYSSVRKGDWKLIHFHTEGRLELYNLREDIGEERDLSAARPEKLRELVEILAGYLKEVEARMPIDKETGLAVEYPAVEQVGK